MSDEDKGNKIGSTVHPKYKLSVRYYQRGIEIKEYGCEPVFYRSRKRATIILIHIAMKHNSGAPVALAGAISTHEDIEWK